MAHTVVAILEAKAGKEAELEVALRAVVEPSRTEETNIEYRLHKSIDNPNQFILYENWESKEKHQQQFTKPYIVELVGKISDFLVKPYEAFFAAEL